MFDARPCGASDSLRCRLPLSTPPRSKTCRGITAIPLTGCSSLKPLSSAAPWSPPTVVSLRTRSRRSGDVSLARRRDRRHLKVLRARDNLRLIVEQRLRSHDRRSVGDTGRRAPLTSCRRTERQPAPASARRLGSISHPARIRVALFRWLVGAERVTCGAVKRSSNEPRRKDRHHPARARHGATVRTAGSE